MGDLIRFPSRPTASPPRFGVAHAVAPGGPVEVDPLTRCESRREQFAVEAVPGDLRFELGSPDDGDRYREVYISLRFARTLYESLPWLIDAAEQMEKDSNARHE